MRCLLALPLLAFQLAFAQEQPPYFVPLPAKHSGDTIQVSDTGNGQQSQIAIPVAKGEKLDPAESSQPPDGSQLLFDGRVSVSAAISLAPSRPQSVMVSLRFTNVDAPPLTLDDAKFFLLDGNGRQLQRLSLEEVKYPILYLVAKIPGSGKYPPAPPPPQRSYAITEAQNGTYTFTEMGNSETPLGNFLEEQTNKADQAAYLLGYSQGTPLRQRADPKRSDQILQQARISLSQWDASYFRSQAPLIPGDNREGNILYWTGSTRSAEGPFKLVIFLADPSNGKQEMVQFEFR